MTTTTPDVQIGLPDDRETWVSPSLSDYVVVRDTAASLTAGGVDNFVYT